jgi:hypothetical protein
MTEITRDLLLHLFHFDLEAGRLFWKSPPWNHPRLLGQEAGAFIPGHSGKRYCHVKIGRKALKRGHLIYFVVHGVWPKPCLDHIDGNSENDCPSNLRQATVAENAKNHKRRSKRENTPMGVRRLSSGNFEARIACDGRKLTIGSFRTAEEAHAAYLAKRKELFHDFA